MQTNILIKNLLRAYEPEVGVNLLEYILRKLQFVLGPLVDFVIVFDDGDQAYCKYLGDNKYRCVVGTELIKRYANVPGVIPDWDELERVFDNLIKGIFGPCAHEASHIYVSDMKSRDIVDYPKPEYRFHLHNLANIEEDIVGEATMGECIPEAGDAFEMGNEHIYKPQADTYTDKGTAGDFYQWLLLMSRLGKSTVKGRNAVYEKYPEIEDMWIDILMTAHSTTRLRAAVAFGEWLVENVPEIDWASAPPTEERSGHGDSTGMGDAVGKAAADKVRGGDPVDTEGGPGDGPGASDGADGDSGDSGGCDSDDEAPGKGATEEKGADEKVAAPKTEFKPTDEIRETVESGIWDGYLHEFVVAKDEYTYDPKVIDKLNEQIATFEEPARETAAYLKLFQGRRKPRKLTGFTRGKLDVGAAMRSEAKSDGNTKLFQQIRPNGISPDLAVICVGDNSGSMSGDKSVLCSRGILTLAQACDWANVPCSVWCFTKTSDSPSGTSVSILEKDFDDSFESAKPYFAINDSGLIRYLTAARRIPTFAGNSEEVNLFHIWKEKLQKKCKHRTRVMFVLCDGATTGSVDTLRNVVKQIEEDGIIVIGIGIMCSEVASIYPKHKLFHSQKELEEQLPQYLIDTLDTYISK